MIDLTDEIKKKLQIVLDNVNKIDFGDKNILPILNNYNWESYEWEADFIGVTKDGKIGYVFDSGCSCNDAEWNADDDEIPSNLEETTLKGLELELESVSDWMGAFDQEQINSNLDKIISVNKL